MLIEETSDFTYFIENIERTPLSDEEICRVLNINEVCLLNAVKSSLIQRTVAIHYRFGTSFKFFGLFDAFEYALRQRLFLLGYGANPEVNELVWELVDELAFIIDNGLCIGPPLNLSQVANRLEVVCWENIDRWRNYWLYDGEIFSTKICSRLAVKTWCSTFQDAIRIINY